MIRVGIAALMLVTGIAVSAQAGMGWYLMTPPFESEGPKAFQLQAEAPIHRWDQVRAFDSAAICEHERAKERATAVQTLGKVVKEGDTNEKATRVVILLLNAKMAAKCIASDDPRLQ